MLFFEFQAAFFQHNLQECQKLCICEIRGTGFSKELSLHFRYLEKEKLIFQKVPAEQDSAGGRLMLSLLRIRSCTVLVLGVGLGFFGFFSF